MAIAAAALIAASAARLAWKLVLKAQHALVGERRTGNPARVVLGILTLLSYYLYPTNVRYLPGWLLTLRPGRGPLSARVPWMPYPAIDELDRRLSPDATAFEYGGGGSTLWLAGRIAHLTTVEHYAPWHVIIDRELRAMGADNCTLLLREPRLRGADPSQTGADRLDYSSSRAEGSFEEYVKAIDGFADGSLDLVVVDGRCRQACLVHAMAKVRPGGLLVLDDSYRERYRDAMRLPASWSRTDYRGIRPVSLSPSQTTVWVRPEEGS